MSSRERQGKMVSVLDQLLGYSMKRAYGAVYDDLAKSLEPVGLSPRAFTTLAVVVENPGVTQSEVARKLGIERSGLVSLVDGLEQRGLLQRQLVPGDRRVQALTPLAKGQDLYATAKARAIEHEGRVFSGLTADERAQLLSLLNRVSSNPEV